MTTAVVDRDKGYAALMRRVQNQLRNRAITVGIHAEESDAPEGDGGLTVGDVANFHEFGMGNNPQRSFIGGWFDANLDENQTAIQKVLEQTVLGKQDLETSLARLGEYFVGGVQAYMNAGIAPELASGGTSYLIQTGQLKSSIRSKVE